MLSQKMCSGFLLLAALSVAACGTSHTPLSDAGLDAAADAAPMDAACPEPVEVASGVLGGACCPDAYGSVALFVAGDGGWVNSGERLCDTDGMMCQSELNLCGDESVCVRSLERDGSGRCLSQAHCDYARQVSGAPDDSGQCYYSDFTPVTTGERTAITCTDAVRGAGLCGQGCPCPNDPPRTGLQCMGASEMHDFGVCALDFCIPNVAVGLGTCDAEHLCMFVDPAYWPGFWSDYALISDDAGTLPAPGGFCVTQAQCDAIEARYPGYWRCLPHGEAYTP